MSSELDACFTKYYEKIRRLAARVRSNGSNPTLNPTALVNEAYLKLRNNSPNFGSGSYEDIVAILANAMYQILVDASRRKLAKKRVPGGLHEQIDLPIEDALTVAQAIEELKREHPRQARIAQARFLLGMTVEETAAALLVSQRTVEREWQEAREWLAARVDLKPPSK